MNYVFEPESIPSIPVADTEQEFAVHRVYCVGKNYVAHVQEMGSDPQRDPPCFFMKPADAVITANKVPYPSGTKNYHYETELVLAIGRQGRNVSVEDAAGYIYGYAIGFDMTRRDLQMASGGLGHPWDTGKGFDYSAPVSKIIKAADIGHVDSGRISLRVNGEIRQDADISQLIWKCDEIVSQLSRLYMIKPGDLVFTGTPAGVGPVLPGDRLVATIDKLGELAIEITEPQ